jgi:hypothetical protein
MKKILLILGMGILLCHPNAYAQVTLDKGSIKVEAAPGEDVKGSINVANPSDKDITIKAYFQDFIYTSPYDGAMELHTLGTTERSCGKWVTLFPEEFIIPAKGSQEVNYSVKVPKDADGGYNGVLFFEKGIEPSAADKSIGLILKRGCSFFVETKNKVKTAQIQEIALNPKDNLDGALFNSGNVILIAGGSYYLMDKDSSISDRGDIAKFYLPAKVKAPFVIKLDKKIPEGNYTLVVNFDLGEGKVAVKEIEIVKDETGKLILGKIND